MFIIAVYVIFLGLIHSNSTFFSKSRNLVRIRYLDNFNFCQWLHYDNENSRFLYAGFYCMKQTARKLLSVFSYNLQEPTQQL